MRRSTPTDLRSAPWWPELLAIKDAHGWAALAKRFGTTETALRRALEAAGETKAPGTPGRKPKRTEAAVGEPAHGQQPAAVDEPGATSGSGDPVEPFASLLGTVPDATVAEKAGVTRWHVARYRVKHGIAAYDGFRFRKEGGGEGAAAEAPAAEAPVPPTAPARAARATGKPAAAPAPSAPRRGRGGRVAAPARTVAPAARNGAHVLVVSDSAASGERGAAAPVASPASGTSAGPNQAWLVLATGNLGTLRVVVLGRDLVEASRHAVAVADARAEGPWAVQSVQWVGELAT